MSYLHTFSISDPDYIWVLVCNKLQSDRKKNHIDIKYFMFGYRKYQKMHLFNMWLYLKQFLYNLLLFTLKICKRAVGYVHFSESFFLYFNLNKSVFEIFLPYVCPCYKSKGVHGTLKSRLY